MRQTGALTRLQDLSSPLTCQTAVRRTWFLPPRAPHQPREEQAASPVRFQPPLVEVCVCVPGYPMAPTALSLLNHCLQVPGPPPPSPAPAGDLSMPGSPQEPQGRAGQAHPPWDTSQLSTAHTPTLDVPPGGQPQRTGSWTPTQPSGAGRAVSSRAAAPGAGPVSGRLSEGSPRLAPGAAPGPEPLPPGHVLWPLQGLSCREPHSLRSRQRMN